MHELEKQVVEDEDQQAQAKNHTASKRLAKAPA